MLNINLIDSILSKFIPDADKRLEAKNLIQNNEQDLLLGQQGINKVEAASKFLFVAGWRPAVGWVCVIALFNNYCLMPYFDDVKHIEIMELLPLLGGMLGLSFNRTQEKIKKVAREQ